MTNQIQAELLVLGLILLGSIRFFFVSHTRKDSLSVVLLVGFIISIFNIFVFGLSFREIVVFLFSLWASVWNFRSILRLVSDVIVDHYDVRLVVISIIDAIACVFLILCVFKFMPAQCNAEKMEVTEKVSTFTGDFEKGFSEVKESFKFTTAKIWNFESRVKNTAGRTIIIFVPPETADVEVYRLMLQKLAKNGYSVYAADFCTKEAEWFNKFFDLPFMRRYSLITSFMNNKDEYKKLHIENKNYLVQEYAYLIKYAAPLENEMVFLLTENDVADVMNTVRNLNGTLIKGSFDLAFLEDNPSKGFGPVENSDPVLAWQLGLEPDRSGYISSHLAMDVTDFISSQLVKGGE
ncbi:MAG: hypothetical protein UHY90_10120 [Treponema sp.]|nr:hypothetical protein [Treponema sp.]